MKLAALLAVGDDALGLQDPQQGADGGPRWWVGEPLMDLADGRLAVGVDDLHDLSFPPAEPYFTGLRHRSSGGIWLSKYQ